MLSIMEEMMEDKELVWQDNTGQYKIGYSQKMQAEDLRLKSSLVWLGYIITIILIGILIFLYLIFNTGLIGVWMRRVVC
jgi:hypothetical protein